MQALARRLEDGGALPGLEICASAQPFLAILLQQQFPQRPIVIVADSLKTQESFQQDLETWLYEVRNAECGVRTETVAPSSILRPPSFPLFYPAWEIFPHEGKLPHADVISDRLQTLIALSDNSSLRTPHSALVVTSVTALLQKTFAPDDLKNRIRVLQRGDKTAPLDLIEWLESQGYEAEAQVTQKGEIAMRGGIVDVFPPTSPWPVRLDFFGDELESLREFDPLTQISRGEILSVTLPPAGELGILKNRSQKSEARSQNENSLATLLDYLPRKTIFLLCEPDLLAVHADTYKQQVPKNDLFFISWADFLVELNRRGFTPVEIFEDADTGRADQQSAIRNPQFESLDAFRPLAERAPEPQVAEAQRREFFAQLHRWLRQDYSVHVFCNNDGERQRFQEIWKELGLDVESSLRLDKSAHRDDATPQIHIGSLARGFLCDEAKLVVVTDAEIFGRYKVQRPRRLKSPHALAVRSAMEIDFADLEEGDLVVHLQHGIGRYLGLKNMPVGRGARGTELSIIASEPATGTECLVIEYAAGDDVNEPPKLYVPVSEAHLVSKYVGAGKANPPLNTLGGTRWHKAKEQTEKAVRDIAAEMLRIQAVRETQPGHACKPDNQWQREFESAFIYEETRDQITAIANTKADQERPKPMDRLICGDVGFGKTEVAIRAAFKCVMDGKQVAILVPTTVLAQQHFNNFRERMADYPIRVELLSRFRTRREQDQVVKNLAAGAVDIVIGTHRIVQDDIAFKDLGLVVIDEEQRFGVQHKEKFKRLRTMVDVLTLSATPIPRTLYLALTGARDMSTIQSPPHDRLPVETIATPYDERTIRDAIQREMSRGGQVFFLHNRVTTIDTMLAKLKSLVPTARIVVGHGQMHADDLEEVMTKFVNGEADVLLSTTIIESGLDIPNANTIIIDRADRFGLSELYQLRGRVGRYKHQAYAYLLLPRHARLLTDVRKRISAMKQYASLGSGFKIAMRDLEIRGAGNLLGSEQSGHITAVGFELYCQLLKQSVGALKGEKVKPRVEVRIALDFLETNNSSFVTHHSSLPNTYITEPQHRIEIYRKLAQATDKPALDALQKELRDRFGPLPPPVELLLAVGELKILASEKAVTAIEVEEDKLKITRRGNYITLGGKFPRLTKKEAKARLKEIKRLLLAI
ncbi:MAG: transcription-repair coupling factor [Verrucomicrobiales bacterium]|nr:transcription-repair coupling factor [Verrucomicrobiales bacterium]